MICQNSEELLRAIISVESYKESERGGVKVIESQISEDILKVRLSEELLRDKLLRNYRESD